MFENLQMTKTQYKVSDFVSWQRMGTLDLSPSFQRRGVWKAGAKSYFVDTVLRGLPVPIIFLRDKRTNWKTMESSREVVDGQQRIRTLLSYIDPTLLPDFDETRDTFTLQAVHNSDYAGKPFSALPPEARQQILDFQFSTHVLPLNIDDRQILQIFARMNATGVNLNPQELRNAEFFGEFKTSMYVLAFEQLPRWREWRIMSEDNIARMLEVELTSELAQLMLKGMRQKTQAALDNLYEEYEFIYPERYEVERRFRIVMDTIADKLGDETRRLFKARARFFGLFAFLYDVQFGIGSPLQTKQPEPVPASYIKRIIQAAHKIQNDEAPEATLEAVARRTTHQGSRQTLLNYFRSEVQHANSSS